MYVEVVKCSYPDFQVLKYGPNLIKLAMLTLLVILQGNIWRFSKIQYSFVYLSKTARNVKMIF